MGLWGHRWHDQINLISRHSQTLARACSLRQLQTQSFNLGSAQNCPCCVIPVARTSWSSGKPNGQVPRAPRVGIRAAGAAVENRLRPSMQLIIRQARKTSRARTTTTFTLSSKAPGKHNITTPSHKQQNSCAGSFRTVYQTFRSGPKTQ
jgi:hypothetical protein